MEILNLEGTWNLVRLADGSVRPMRVPGDIYSALIESGELSDPYFGENELACQWPGREDWRIERTFSVNDSLFASSTLRLIAEVIDTVGEVYINGECIGKSANMFRRFDADLRGFLHRGENRIAIIVRSPERAAIEATASLPYPIPASTYPITSPHRNLIRKAQCMSGWDWGPCLMTGGIYDGIRIIGTDGPLLRSVRTHLKPLGPFKEVREHGPDFAVDIEAEIEVPEAMYVRLAVWVAGEKTEVLHRCPAGISIVLARLDVRSPRLWWPNGSGKSALYDLHVAVWRASKLDEESSTSSTQSAPRAPSSPPPTPKLTHSSPYILHKKIGFRTVNVITEEDEIGRSFKFSINGRDIFAKGANWIPADALPSRWTRARIADILDSAVRAHMNCLRVWGGGRYESDEFYELCDERGILLWQDCMFSCALYPSDTQFLGNVEEEISWQVKRLADHPSLALWCGNNEALGAINWYDESRKNPARYIVDYDRLTEGVLGRVIRELDPDRCFWPSSPSAGPNDFSDNWHSDERGDMHFWSVWHEGKPFSEYQSVKPRFCSEFGFQAFPSMPTIASFAPQSEWNVSSPTMEAHQKHPRGNSLIIETMLRYFRMPKGFAELVYLSQVQQALAIRTAIQYWRSSMPRCMGTLYWQLNDVWPVTSWSSLNYDGSWKLLHYEAARLFAPALLALFIEDDIIRVRLVSETAGAGQTATVLLRLLTFDGQEVEMPEVEKKIEMENNTVHQIWDMPLATLSRAPNEVFIEATLSISNLGIETVDALFLTEPKRCSLFDPGLHATQSESGDGTTILSIEAMKAPAFFVAPELEGVSGQFEDSGFYLPRGKTRMLNYECRPRSAGKLSSKGALNCAPHQATVRFYDLWSSYKS